MTKYLHGMMRMEGRGGRVVMKKDKIRIPKEIFDERSVLRSREDSEEEDDIHERSRK